MPRIRSWLCGFLGLLALGGVVPIWILAHDIVRLRLEVSQMEPQARNPGTSDFLQRELADGERALTAARTDLSQAAALRNPKPERPFGEKIHDPEIQADFHRSVLSIVNSRYDALFSALKLDAGRAQRLRDILSDRTLGAGENVPSLFSDNAQTSPPPDPRKFRSAIDDEVRTVLRGDEYESYRAYETTLPGRNLVDQIQRQLGAVATPMTNGQAAEILALALSQPTDGAKSRGATSSNQEADALGASVTNLSDGLMQRAAALLTPEQLAVLSNVREQQEAQTRLDDVIRRTEEEVH